MADELAIPGPRLAHPDEIQPIEECLARVKKPLTTGELQRLKEMGKQEPVPVVVAPALTAEDVMIETKKVDEQLRNHGFSGNQTARLHRNREV